MREADWNGWSTTCCSPSGEWNLQEITAGREAFLKELDRFEGYLYDEWFGVELSAVVVGVFRENLWPGCVDSRRPQLAGSFFNVCGAFDAKTKVMQSRSIRVVRMVGFCRAQNITEVPIEILDVGIAADRKGVLPESQDGHDPVVKSFGAGKVAHRNVDMVDSNDFWHGAVQRAFSAGIR